MTESFEQLLQKYDYAYPKKLVALKPASPRDSARLLVYDRVHNKLENSTFLKLPDFLFEDTVLVFNQTKVLPARIDVKKTTGGRAEVLYLENKGGGFLGLCSKKVLPGQKLFFTETDTLLCSSVHNGQYVFVPSCGMQKFLNLLRSKGKIPLPPYLKESSLSEAQRKKEYQTVFGKKEGSSAAPTASLHFTKRLLNKLKKKGVQMEFVTLHVGLGTFAKLTDENISTGKLHSEYYEVDRATAKRLQQAKKQGKKIVAVGTTVVRTLETVFGDGRNSKSTGQTDIFIREEDRLKFVDGLITNFHVPKSSLLMLVSAFVGREKLMSLYSYAVAKKYRLFSFGDGMYIK